MRFKDLSIRRKLTILLMGISTSAVLIACLIFYFLIVDRYQKSYTSDLASLADITATNCSASLAFEIPEDAEQLLASLKKRPSISQAIIYDKQGNIFTTFSRSSTHKTDNNSNGPLTNNQSPALLLSHDIDLNGKTIGEISLYDDMSSIRSFKRVALIIAASIIIVVLGLTALVAARLKEIISTPISALANIAQEISMKQDYSLRATKDGADEVGNLVDAFNGMLSQVGQRNQDLQRSEVRFRSFVNQAVDAFFLHDMDGRLIDVNQRACDSLGYSREELLAMTVADIDPALDTDECKQKYWTKMIPEHPITIEGRHLKKTGESFPVEVRIGLLELGEQKYIMALVRDITERVVAEKERRTLESHLQQAQKMESIGTLAGGIAHDFNNILTPIFGYLELAMLKARNDLELASHLTQIQKAADRARDMVKQILTFSRRDTDTLSPVQAHIIVKEGLKLLRASIPTTIEIKESIDPACGTVLANPTQIHQILMNLCTNAYHAMRETGGIIGVSLIPLKISTQDFIEKIDLKPGSYLQLSVSDTGHGIPPAILDRIFEPYFTTKVKGEGTGMGLSVIHGIVKTMGGHISVYSELEKGTTFKVYLPVIKNSISSEDIVGDSAVMKGTERIMLVDDEASVRNVEKELLTSIGYHVEGFANPIEALEHFSSHPETYDLIITDMTMPKMTGDKLAQELMAVRSDIPVILCTGFSDLIGEESAKALGIKEFITKPIIIRSFSQKIRKILDGEKED